MSLRSSFEFASHVLCHALAIVLHYKLIPKMSGVICFYSYAHPWLCLYFPHSSGFGHKAPSQEGVGDCGPSDDSSER